jgi:hypothetical protein
MSAEVHAIGQWRNNAEMFVDVARLGYLDGSVLDATYGEGAFWNLHRPDGLVTNDLHKSADHAHDYKHLPWPDRSFDVVVYDPPYKLQGTPRMGAFDGRYGLEGRVRDVPDDFDKWYGTGKSVPWQERMADIAAGAVECYRVSAKWLLVKCQDQVASAKVRWQTDVVTEAVERAGGRKADRFDLTSAPRPQPGSRRQVHARRNHSTLLIFEVSP